jgi:hypothetical protein
MDNKNKTPTSCTCTCTCTTKPHHDDDTVEQQDDVQNVHDDALQQQHDDAAQQQQQQHDDAAQQQQQDDATQHHDMILKSDQTRFVDYSFGKVTTDSLVVAGDLYLSGIAIGNPTDGGTLTIPANISFVIIQSLYPYTSLTITLPVQPVLGKILTIVSTVSVQAVTFTSDSQFSTAVPTSIAPAQSLKLIFAGTWFIMT